MEYNKFLLHSGLFLRQIREVALADLHLTQERVASDMKMSTQTLYRIETGQNLTWARMDQLFAYYCNYDGVRERYADTYHRLSNVERIPEGDFLKLESNNVQDGELSEYVLDLYREAEEACEVKVRKISY